MSDWDRQTTAGGVEGPQWVSAAEAADVAGVTPGTVRYWARNGLIVSEVVESPGGEKTLVRLDEVLRHARQEGPSRPSSEGAGPGPAAYPGRPGGDVVTDLPARTSELAPILQSIPEIMAQLTAATDRAARAETKVEFLSAQVADLRRRLAEADAGDGTPAAVVPEAWEQTDPAAATIAEEPAEAAPGATGWPAPPPDALKDVPEPASEPPEPAPDAIDWTSRDTPADDLSLDEIWNRAPAAAQAVDPVAEPPEPAQSEVDWHEPAGRAASGDAPATSARPANAPVPEGDDFYAAPRRRWFRRRR